MLPPLVAIVVVDRMGRRFLLVISLEQGSEVKVQPLQVF